MRNIVQLSKKAIKNVQKAPKQVQMKAAFWRKLVETKGLLTSRKVKGFHDEPLKGDRKGQRSIKLNVQWRAIYVTRIGLDKKEIVEIVDVLEITPHKY